MLAARGLVLGHGGQALGTGFGLDLRAGEVACVLGTNGSGKTTLFRTLLGLIPPVAGQVALDGRPLRDWPRAALARRLAYVPQAHLPPFPWRVEEVVMMGRLARNGPFSGPSRADRGAVAQALAAMGLDGFAGADYARLSGGQRQMVLIARALAQEAALIVMDEPAASLDFANRARFLDRIKALAEVSGCGVVIATHEPDHAFALDARAIALRDGTVCGDGPARALLSDGFLSRLYGIPVAVEVTASGRVACTVRGGDPSLGPPLSPPA